MVFLHSHGVGTARAVRIYKTYGVDAIPLLRDNPYRLAREIPGIGFVVADRLYRELRAAGPPVPERFDAAALATLDAAARALESAPAPSGYGDELTLRVRRLGATRLSVRSSFASEDDASALAAGDERIRAMRLSRNFGQHNALIAGVRAARHDVIVTMDDDL